MLMFINDPILSAPFRDKLFAPIILRSNFDQYIQVHYRTSLSGKLFNIQRRAKSVFQEWADKIGSLMYFATASMHLHLNMCLIQTKWLKYA